MTYSRVIPVLGMVGNVELREEPGEKFAFYRDGDKMRTLSEFEDEFVRSALAWRAGKLESVLLDIMRLWADGYLTHAADSKAALDRAHDLLQGRRVESMERKPWATLEEVEKARAERDRLLALLGRLVNGTLSETEAALTEAKAIVGTPFAVQKPEGK